MERVLGIQLTSGETFCVGQPPPMMAEWQIVNITSIHQRDNGNWSLICGGVPDNADRSQGVVFEVTVYPEAVAAVYRERTIP